MVLEAIEDHKRGYHQVGMSMLGMRVPRSGFWIEHVMPQSWETSWAPPLLETSQGTCSPAHTYIRQSHTIDCKTQRRRIERSVGWRCWKGCWKEGCAQGARSLCCSIGIWIRSGMMGGQTSQSHCELKNLSRQLSIIWTVPPGYKASTVRDVARRLIPSTCPTFCLLVN